MPIECLEENDLNNAESFWMQQLKGILFFQVGFTKISYYKYGKGANINFPLNSITITAIRTLETLIDQLPASLKRKAAKALLFRGVTMIGVK